MKPLENKNKTPILIWGASGQAEVVTDILASTDEYSIAAYIDNSGSERQHNLFLSKPVLHTFEDVRKQYRKGIHHVIVAIGDINTRVKITKTLVDMDFSFINAIHRTAIISNRANIGLNTIIKAGAIIDPSVTTGNHCYIGAGVTIGHNSSIGEFVNITGGSKISGHVQIGERVFIGTGCAVKDHVTIGKTSVIGVGSVAVSYTHLTLPTIYSV